MSGCLMSYNTNMCTIETYYAKNGSKMLYSETVINLQTISDSQHFGYAFPFCNK